MKEILIIFGAIIIVSIIILFIIFYIRWQNKLQIDVEINEQKIIKYFLNKTNINIKYLKIIEQNINIIWILDNLNYKDSGKYYVSKLEAIENCEKTINKQNEKIQGYSFRSKRKIIFSKNIIKKQLDSIVNNYIEIIKNIFKDENNLTIQLLDKIQTKIKKIRIDIEKQIANEKKDEIEIWKSEVEMLERYINLDDSLQQLKNNILKNN